MTTLPHAIPTEYAILGAVLVKNDLLSRIAFLAPEHFYSSPHAEIFRSMLRLHQSGEPITPFNITVDSNTAETVKDSGGLQRYLSGSISDSMMIYDVVQQAKQVMALAKKREFIATCRQAADIAACEDDESPADEHAATLVGDIDEAMKTGLSEFKNDAEVIFDIASSLNSAEKPDSTGLHLLDKAMSGGLYRFRSYGFAARKKVGKTVLASTISCNLNHQGVKHLFICGEMSPKEIHQRTIARLLNCSPESFYGDVGKSDEFYKRVVALAEQSKKCTLYHNAPGLTFTELKRVVALGVYRYNIAGFILDYWQLVGGKPTNKSTAEHLDEVAQWIADFCRKHGVWSITMGQINQTGNTRGGEGMRLAFDQVYALRGMGEQEDISEPDRWMDMLDTRYTKWMSIGNENTARFTMNPHGPYFEEV